MVALKQREDPVRLLGKRFLLAALCVLAVVGAFAVWNTYQKERESAILDGEAQAMALDITDREAKLKSDIAKLQTDRGKETALRQQYALAAEGERVIVIVNQSAQTAPTASSSAFIEWLHKTLPWW